MSLTTDCSSQLLASRGLRLSSVSRDFRLCVQRSCFALQGGRGGEQSKLGVSLVGGKRPPAT
eukprot:40395-Chlamydomonas_euryale.AAC.2